MTLADLIGATHGAAAAQHFQQTMPTQTEGDALIAAAREALVVLPRLPGACLMMSALIASRTASLTTYPAYVAAGTLSVGRIRIFGDDAPFDGR